MIKHHVNLKILVKRHVIFVTSYRGSVTRVSKAFWMVVSSKSVLLVYIRSGIIVVNTLFELVDIFHVIGHDSHEVLGESIGFRNSELSRVYLHLSIDPQAKW